MDWPLFYFCPPRHSPYFIVLAHVGTQIIDSPCGVNGKVRTVAAMLKAIHVQKCRDAAQRKAQDVIERLKTMNLRTAEALVDSAVNETFTFYAYPPQHWLKIKTNNPMERLLKEVRRRPRVVGAFR